ncbi:MAG: hypothetical protein IJ412_12745 [Oscillospiraceae bacterium]|nr:hypothetical protein [Oscillospiraceae bacterium]
MAFEAPLTYKGRPLVRCKNQIYYGSMSDPYVVFMQILSTKEENGVQMADRVHLSMLSTDPTKPLAERMIRQSDKNGLFAALDISCIWLEKAAVQK